MVLARYQLGSLHNVFQQPHSVQFHYLVVLGLAHIFFGNTNVQDFHNVPLLSVIDSAQMTILIHLIMKNAMKLAMSAKTLDLV